MRLAFVWIRRWPEYRHLDDILGLADAARQRPGRAVFANRPKGPDRFRVRVFNEQVLTFNACLKTFADNVTEGWRLS